MKSYRDYFQVQPATQRPDRLDRFLSVAYPVLLAVSVVNFVVVLIIASTK